MRINGWDHRKYSASEFRPKEDIARSEKTREIVISLTVFSVFIGLVGWMLFAAVTS